MRRLKTPWKKQSRRQLLYVCNEINQINEINWVYIWRSWAHDWYLWLTPIHRPKFLSSVIFFPDLFVMIFSHFCLFMWDWGFGVGVFDWAFGVRISSWWGFGLCFLEFKISMCSKCQPCQGELGVSFCTLLDLEGVLEWAGGAVIGMNYVVPIES